MKRRGPKLSTAERPAITRERPEEHTGGVVDIFAGRIRAAMAIGDDPIGMPGSFWTIREAYVAWGFDPRTPEATNELAERLAAHLHNVVAAYQVPKREREAVAERMARHWFLADVPVPEDVGMPPQASGECPEYRRARWRLDGPRHLAGIEYQGERAGAIKPRLIWPTNVSLDEARAVLERSKDPTARSMAGTIREGRWYVVEGGGTLLEGSWSPRREEYVPVYEDEGEQDPEAPRRGSPAEGGRRVREWRIAPAERWRGLETPFHPRIAALVVWAEKEVERGQREARFFALPASIQSRVPFEMMAQGETYAPRELQRDTELRAGSKAVVTRALRVVWDGRPAGEQLAFGFAIRAVQAEVFRDILRELRAEGLRDYVILHRMAAEQGRTGRFTWTWEAHRRATLHDRRVQLGNVKDDVARDTTVDRIWKLARAELHAEETAQEPGKPARRRWHVVGEAPLVRVVGGDEEGGRIEGLTLILNETLYRGARAEEGKYFTQLPEAVLRLPPLPFCLAVMLGFRFRYARDKGGAVELEGEELQGYMDAGRWRGRWREAATDTLHRALTEAAGAFGEGARWEAVEGGRYRVTPPQAWVDAVVHCVPPVLPPARNKGPTTGAELVAWREARDLSQRAAAVALGVGFRTVQRAEGSPNEALSRAFRDLDWSKVPLPGK